MSVPSATPPQDPLPASTNGGSSGSQAPKPKLGSVVQVSRWKLLTRTDLRDIWAVDQALALRSDVLEVATARLAEAINVDVDRARRLATTDLFVEKAQRVLTRRARTLYLSGLLSAVLAVLSLAGGIGFAAWRILTQHDPGLLASSIGLVVLTIFQTIALGAFVYVTVKWFIQLARSFFHESLSLYERRHALRFGRLWMYITDEPLTLDELEQAFNWNRTTVTSFLDINAAVITRTLFHDLADAISKAPKEVIEKVVDAAKKKTLP